jgi:hypothetical protein
MMKEESWKRKEKKRKEKSQITPLTSWLILFSPMRRKAIMILLEVLIEDFCLLWVIVIVVGSWE